MSNGFVQTDNLVLNTEESITIASGVATIGASRVELNAESATSDDVDSFAINSAVGVTGGVLVVVYPASGDTITLVHSSSIICPGGADAVLSDTESVIIIVDASVARVIGFS